MALFGVPNIVGKDRWTVTPLMLRDDRIVFENTLFQILEYADRRKIDPRPLVQLYAKEHWGINRFRLNSFAKKLSPDLSIEESLVVCGVPRDSHIIVCLRIGRLISQTSLAWKDVVQWHRPIHLDAAKIWRNQMLYWTIVGMLVLNISVAFWFFLGGRLRKLLRETGPTFAESQMDWLETGSLVLIGLLMSAMLLYWLFRFARWLIGGPILGRFENHHAFKVKRSEVQRQMALCLDAGLSERDALETILKCNSNSRIQRQIHRTLRECDRGLNTWEAISRANLLDPRWIRILDRSCRSDVQAWSLKHLSFHDRQSGYLARTFRGLWIQPALTLAFGLVVLMIGYSVIGELNQLLRYISEAHG